MITIHSENDKRMIVRGSLNGQDAYILVDTGATAGILDKSSEKKYKLNVDRRKEMYLVGAGGGFKAYLVTTPLKLGGKDVYQFLLADISSVVNSIQKETGIRIAGLISLSQCKTLHISIDTDDNYLTVE